MMETIGHFVLFAVAYGTPSMLILIHVLHLILPKKFDAIWFNEKFFSDAELAIYSSYPLSLVRTLGYSATICLPFLMKKHFSDLNPTKEINIFIKSLNYIFLIIVLLMLLASLFSLVAAFVLD